MGTASSTTHAPMMRWLSMAASYVVMRHTRARHDLTWAQLRIFSRNAAAKSGTVKRRRGNFPARGAAGSAELGDDFREVVQPLARPVRADQIIVADPRHHVAADVGRVHHDVHVLGDRHRLVVANERPLDQIVALAVA